jgi:hypothetical protein
MKPPKRRPAPPVSKHERVRGIERDARVTYHIKKVFISEGKEAALDALRVLMPPDDDPANASAQASVSVSFIDEWITRDESTQAGRSDGGKGRAKQRREDATKDYAWICDLASKLLGHESKLAPKDVPAIIRSRTGFSLPKVYRALEQHPLGHWKKG